MIPTIHIARATDILSPRVRPSSTARLAAAAGRWLSQVSREIAFSATAEGQIWADRFSRLKEMEYTYSRQDTSLNHKENDRRNMRREVQRRQRRLEVLGSIWMRTHGKV